MISIIIPAYNEEKRIGETLRRIIKYFKKLKYEIIVIDDGSTDRTVEVVKNFNNRNIRIIKNEKNIGKGYSIKRGIYEARYPLILYSDSDLSTPIEEIEKLMRYIDRYDIVIASRNLRGSKIIVKQPLDRQILGKIFRIILKIFIFKDIQDSQCGFKLFKTEKAIEIAKKSRFNEFSFDFEFLFIAKKLGYKIKEVPVVWIDKKGTRLKTLKDGLNMLINLFRIRLNEINGCYNK